MFFKSWPDTEQPKFQNAKYVHLLYALKHM